MYTAFITGCGSGFGFLLAERLLRDGHRVVATDPDATALGAALGSHERLLVLGLDVRDDAAVASATARALAWGPVDLVVNNAGVAIFGSQEEVPVDAVRDLFDVNTFGPVRVTRALLPALRARKGTVVQISSLAGRTVFPESGFYAATKYALEALSEALFQETCTFGVRIRLVEPGSFATRFQERAAALSPSRDPASPYASLRQVWDTRKREVLEPPQDPTAVVDAIVLALADPAPFARVVVGPDAQRILGLRDALGPDRWSRLAADRAGLSAPHRVGEVAHPGELTVADPASIEATRTADQHGHLSHWPGDALATLRRDTSIPPRN